MRIKQFVSGLQLGDRKPTHLLNDLRRVGGESQDEKLLRGLWMQRLPIEVQTCLATVQSPLSELADLADSVMETFRIGNGSTGASISAASTSSAVKPTNAVDELRKEIQELRKQISNMHIERRSRSRSRSQSQARNSRSQTPGRSSNTSGDSTEYHQVYGNDAQKCREPCTYKSTTSKN